MGASDAKLFGGSVVCELAWIRNPQMRPPTLLNRPPTALPQDARRLIYYFQQNRPPTSWESARRLHGFYEPFKQHVTDSKQLLKPTKNVYTYVINIVVSIVV